MSGTAYGKQVADMSTDYDGETLADEGNVVIYGETVEQIEKETGLSIQMV